MSAPFTFVLRQLVFPTGLAVVLGFVGLAFVPTPAVNEHAPWMVPAIIVMAAGAAIRLRTLRAFMALCALGAAVAALQLSGLEVSRLVLALLACDLVLVLLADDTYFDWQAVQWWLGLLLAQWVIFVAGARWSPLVVAGVESTALPLFGAGVSVLTLFMGLCTAALLLRFYFIPDPVSAGLVWASAALALGSGPAAVALAGLALGVGVLERTHWIAYHDELTGLAGRRAFNEALAALGERYSIAVVDVDHFKKFNDTFGHDTGDQVLRKVAASLAAARNGRAFRCGGEEFAIVYADLESADALESAEAVRQAIEADSFIVRGPARSQRERPERRATKRPGRIERPIEVSVTVSIGLAQGSATADPDDVVKQADKALYAAKEAGRNRVEVFRPTRPRRTATAAPGRAIS